MSSTQPTLAHLPLVLLVEDARSYRAVMRRILAPVDREGHPEPLVRLLEADNSLDALQLLAYQHAADPIRLVIADDRMPGLQGNELLDIVGMRWPGVARLLLSGYLTGERVMERGDYPVLDKDNPSWLIRDTVLRLVR